MNVFGRNLVIAAAVVASIIVMAGVASGIWMAVKERPINDALIVMGTPILGVALLAVVGSGIYSYTRENANDLPSLRLRIVGVLGMVLVIAVIGVLVLQQQETSVPGEFVAVISTIVGGLIGVLTPPSRPDASQDGTVGAERIRD